LGKRRVLVVANRTADSDDLVDVLRERVRQGPVSFLLLVPAKPHGVTWAADMHPGAIESREHMQRAVRHMKAAGLDVEGRLGDPDPVVAVEDAVREGERFDEAIVSTGPVHLSQWVKLDLPRRVELATGVSVRHAVSSEAHVATNR
jgi:hypothetical protein